MIALGSEAGEMRKRTTVVTRKSLKRWWKFPRFSKKNPFVQTKKCSLVQAVEV